MSNLSIEKVIIHAGLHKTGSTSVQDTFYSNRVSLIEKGIFFPTKWYNLYSVFCENPELYFNHRRNNRTRKQIDEYNAKNKMEFSQEIEIIDSKTVLISEESFSMLKKSSLYKMKEFILRIAPNAKIEVTIFVRSPYGF